MGSVFVFRLHQNLAYGQTKEFNCEHCHSKLSVLAESTRFQYIPPRANKPGQTSPTFALKAISSGPRSCSNKQPQLAQRPMLPHIVIGANIM